MNDSLKDKLLENLKHLAKDALIHIEAYNYMAIFWRNWYLYIGILNTFLASIASSWQTSSEKHKELICGETSNPSKSLEILGT
jgi:hypothetical protein